MHTYFSFYQLGEKYAFPPLLTIPFNNFFIQTCYLAIFFFWGGGPGVKQKNIHPLGYVNSKKVTVKSKSPPLRVRENGHNMWHKKVPTDSYGKSN